MYWTTPERIRSRSPKGPGEKHKGLVRLEADLFAPLVVVGAGPVHAPHRRLEGGPTRLHLHLLLERRGVQHVFVFAEDESAEAELPSALFVLEVLAADLGDHGVALRNEPARPLLLRLDLAGVAKVPPWR